MFTLDGLTQRTPALGILLALVILQGGLCRTKLNTRPSEGTDTSKSTSCYETAGVTIRGTVLSVTCNPSSIAKVEETEVHSNKCTEVFRWHVPEEWCSPVVLLYNVTVPMIRKLMARRIVDVELNLTVGGWQEARVRWEEDVLNEENMRYVKKTCNYTATILFSAAKNDSKKSEELKKLQRMCHREETSASGGNRIICLIQGKYEQNVCRLRRDDQSE